MVFRPALPLTGVAGANFLQRTLDRQLDALSNSPEVQNDRAYFREATSQPISVEDFLGDRRLLRISLTAFGLAGEETKGGFVRRVLESVVDPDDQFLERINNPAYARFAEAFTPQDGFISLSDGAEAQIIQDFEREVFEIAVGEVNTDLRVDLNYRNEISDLVGEGSSDEAILFRLLGSVPVRTLLEGALNLPTEIRSLDIERQAEILQDRLTSVFGLSDLTELSDPENIDRITRRYHAIQSALQGPSQSTPGFTALSILTGVGGQASENIFLSRFL